MLKKKRYELLKLSEHIGVFDPKKKVRLQNLYPTKKVDIKAKATAFEKGYTIYQSTDLHKMLAKKRTISHEEYKKLMKKYGK